MGSRGPDQTFEERIVLTDLDLTRADLSGRRTKHLTVGSCRFTECDFRGLEISEGGSFGGGGRYSEYVDCVFDHGSFTRVMAGRATFVRCSFRDVRIRRLFSHDAEFVDCVFTGRIRVAVFNGHPQRYEGMIPNPKEALEFRGNDFSGAVLEDVGFRTGVDLRRQFLPSGRDYLLVLDAGSVLRRAQEIVEKLPAADPHRASLRATLRVGLDDLKSGQSDFFRSPVNRKDAENISALRTVMERAQAELQEN